MLNAAPLEQHLSYQSLGMRRKFLICLRLCRTTNIMFMVVAYDISDDRRRNKAAEVLEHYGRRVNYSVFECELKKGEIRRMKRELENVIDVKKDVVKYYYLCKACVPKRETCGGCNTSPETDDDNGIVMA